MLLNKRTTSENTRYPTKRLRTRLTFAQKKDVCVKLSSKPKPSQGELAEEYGVKQNTISDIWKNKEKWLAINSESKEFNRMSNRRPLFPQVEAALVTWITQALSDNQTLTGDILQLKARHFAQLLEIENFTASNGWLRGFKRRFQIRQYVKHGESRSAPLHTLEDERMRLREIMGEYDLNDVFNSDETALYWQLEPSKTLAVNTVSGTKKSKNRVTILLTCNATGTEKLRPLFIHRYKNPRALLQKKKEDLPVDYYWNHTAWMQHSIWDDFLKKLNRQMSQQSRRILLLVDNATTHVNAQLSHVKVHYLPANTTAHLQPCDAGIINSFKAQYRRRFVENRIETYDLARELKKEIISLNISDAIEFVVDAWKNVSQSTIQNCWKKTGILPIESSEADINTDQTDNDMNELEYECLQHLINELNTNNPMNAVEFVSFDNDIQTRGMTDEEIVSSVQSMSKDTESDGEEEIETVSIKNALESLNNVFNFLVHPPAGFNCDASTVSTVRSLRKQVLMHHINNKKQSLLDGFVIRM